MPTYEDLVRDHYALVYRIARSLLAETAAAEDVTQDVFLDFLRNPAPIGRAQSPKAFVARAAINRSMSVLRSRRRRERREEAAAPMRGPMDPVEAAFRTEVREKVKELPEDLRLSVELHYFRGLTVREAGLALEIPSGTVSSRLATALKLLRAGLGVAAWAGMVASLESELSPCGAEEIPAGLEARLRGLARSGGLSGRSSQLLGASLVVLCLLLASLIAWRIRSSAAESRGELNGEAGASVSEGGHSKGEPGGAKAPSGPRGATLPPLDPKLDNEDHDPRGVVIKGRLVTVSVVDTTGAPLADIGIHVVADAAKWSLQTDAEGTTSFSAAGQLRVYLWGAPEGILGADGGVEIAADETALRIVVEDASSISGRVLGPDGIPVTGAEIEVRGDRLTRIVNSEDDGTFRVVVPGRTLHTLILTGLHSRISGGGAKREVEDLGMDGRLENVEAGSSEVVLRANRTESDQILSALVLQPDGKPAEGASVTLGSTAGDRSLLTDAVGRVRFEGLPRRGHMVWVDVREKDPASTWIHRLVEDVVPAGQEITLQFREGVLVRGTVVGPEGELLENAQVTAWSGRRQVWGGDIGARDGRFVLILDPEEFQVEMTLVGSWQAVGKDPLTGRLERVRPGDDVTLRLWPVR